MTQADYARHDRITLTGITAKGYHGVLDFEKRDGQPFVVDATLYSDFSAAAATDDLTKTTNYALVVDLIHRHVTNGSLDLIETLAVNIAEGILAMFEYVEGLRVDTAEHESAHVSSGIDVRSPVPQFQKRHLQHVIHVGIAQQPCGIAPQLWV